MLPSKIISGGQTGADRAALEFALSQGIEPGGWCPKGGRCEGGSISAEDMKRFRLRETAAWGYEERTRLNVRDGDATLIFNRSDALSRGCTLTANTCTQLNKRFKVFRLSRDWFPAGPSNGAIHAIGRQVAEFLKETQPRILNVAGNREGTTPGIGAIVTAVLASAWVQYESVAAAAPLPEDRQMSLGQVFDSAPSISIAGARTSRAR